MINDFFSHQTLPPKLVAAKAKAKLQQYRKREAGTILYFGFKELDKIIAMVKGNYYLVAARPGVGKTAFLLQMVGTTRRQLPDTHAVQVFSAEMDAAALALREACGRERLSYWKMMTGGLTDEEYARVERRVEEGLSLTYIDETPAPTLEHMAEQCQALVDSGMKMGLIMFDYLQLGGDLGRDEKSRVDKISVGLAALAKQFDCPVLALGQTNRSIEQGKPPGLNQLMYGGEQQPSGVLILDRPHLTDPTIPKELVDCYIPKHRHGPTGHVTLHYSAETMRFSSGVVERVPL